ncbi:hypothetical protein [Bacillus sp. FJAT-52991]|uniref:Uncharacterized protein n=1 Tax=Bacillus kandeliae TaxID=3129297 RepID=A0ABZ2NCG4_9BACI
MKQQKMIEVLKRARNIEFTGNHYVQGLGDNVATFSLIEPTAEEWNAKAEAQNTKMFVDRFNRQPKSYSEVAAWINDLIGSNKEKNRLAGNKTVQA